MKGIDVIVEQAGARYQIAVVRVLGQIDTTTSHELERRIQYLLKDGQFDIAIDLSKVTYISSAGWGIFISEIRGIRESGGDLKLVGMTPEVSEVFELLEFHNILESFKSVEAAVERFEKPKASVAEQKQVSVEGTQPMKTAEPAAAEANGELRSGLVPGSQPGTDPEPAKAEEKGAAVWPARKSQAPVDRTGGGVTEASQNGKVSQGTEKSRDASASNVESEYAEGGMKKWESADVQPGGGVKSANAGPVSRGTAANEDAVQAQPLSKDLESMILEIVREHPDYGCLRIRKEILEHDYRRPINPLALFMELKRLNLETKDKRKRYSESAVVAGGKR